MSFSNEEILAITKALSSKEVSAARKQINSSSEVDINLMVKIVGKLKRGEPSESKGTSRIPWKVAIALLLKRSGVTGPNSIKLLASTIQDAVAMNKEARDEILNENGVGDALQVVDRELCSKLPKIQKDGNITFESAEVQAIRVPIEVADFDSETFGEGEEVAK